MMLHAKKLGFTLVELLIVIAIIGVLVAVIFVALDPATRLAQARDAVRQNDVGEILSAIKLYQVDHDGQHLNTIANLSQLSVYMAVNGGGMDEGCDDSNISCTTPVTQDTHCVNIHDLIQEGYLTDMPVSPVGEVIWDVGDNAGDNGSGYTISLDVNGGVIVRSCENEATTVEIEASR
jgi:prepilin-type N-terminal cleavage/methylation domain-containing protein